MPDYASSNDLSILVDNYRKVKISFGSKVWNLTFVDWVYEINNFDLKLFFKTSKQIKINLHFSRHDEFFRPLMRWIDQSQDSCSFKDP